MVVYRSKSHKKQTYIDRVRWASDLIKGVPLTGPRVGVEVGLWKADFARLMLIENPDLRWFGVDPYFPYGKKYRRKEQWDEIYQRVVTKMEEFEDRFTLVRRMSRDALSFIPDEIDFIFIDGNHDYDYVLEDIRLFEPKVKSGGILAGHDYRVEKDGVTKAVHDYIKENPRDLKSTEDFDPCGVFWWEVR